MPSWSNPQSLAFIPTGKLVTFMALHQAGDTQYVQIIDSNLQPIQFEPMLGGSAEFPISGQGSTVGFFDNGVGKFIMQDGFQIQFGSSASSPPTVAATGPNEFFINKVNKGGGALFVTEDGGDQDYNDTSFVIQYYGSQG